MVGIIVIILSFLGVVFATPGDLGARGDNFLLVYVLFGCAELLLPTSDRMVHFITVPEALSVWAVSRVCAEGGHRYCSDGPDPEGVGLARLARGRVSPP